jgi:hypothetical protein
MQMLDQHDIGTNAPSENFIYEFEEYRYLVRDEWRELYSHDAMGQGAGGSFEALMSAFEEGCEIKVAIAGLCSEFCEDPDRAPRHEIFVQCGPGYYETVSKRFAAGAQPTVRVKPAVPMRYQSQGWDFGWLLPRTDGTVFRWLCNPYTLQFEKSENRYPIRWFAR